MPEIRTTSSTGGQKGVKLERHDLIPQGPLKELAEHYGKGAAKYAEHQWRAGYEWSKSYSAIARHSRAFWAGEDYDVCSNDFEGCAFLLKNGEVLSIDRRKISFILEAGYRAVIRVHEDDRRYEPVPEMIGDDTCYNHTGSHHMVCVAWHSFLLLEFKDTHPEHDDRYKIDPFADFDLNRIAMPGDETPIQTRTSRAIPFRTRYEDDETALQTDTVHTPYGDAEVVTEITRERFEEQFGEVADPVWEWIITRNRKNP